MATWRQPARTRLASLSRTACPWRTSCAPDAPTISKVADTAPQFSNEPLLELRRGDVRAELLAALARLDPRLPLSVPVLIAGERGAHDGLISSDPGEPERVVAVAGAAQPSDVTAAVAAAQAGARAWSALAPSRRAEILDEAAARLRVRRLELAALAVRECAKPWAEADADVCEAIDHLRYSAAGALALAAGRPLVQLPGERNELRYVPRGVAAVIAPWNFPLAIPAGMVAGALAAGNAVLLKPAEQSPACALALVEALHGAGVPPAALALLPGAGDVGAALVRDPRVQVIAFTGSSEVGLEIIGAAAQMRDGQAHVKHVVAEMGGKNCMLVDADADLDDAVPAIVRSAFHYAGQKCSAAARVIAHEAIADQLTRRLAGAVTLLAVGQAQDFATEVPPLIERSAQQRVQSCAERAAREGRIVAQVDRIPSRGWFCAPTLAGELPLSSPLLREEIFGPLLTIEAVPGLDAACAIVEELPFGLTAGLFARDPATVERIAARLPVGNLYVNRAITGAMVGRQPFGGSRRSGTGAKVGGPDYLLEFVESRVVSESTVRHGLVM